MRRAGKLGAAGLVLAVGFIGAWEGLRLNAYRDIVGVPTICYGETKGVRLGDKRTKAECDAMFSRRILEFEAAIDRCITEENLPLKSKVAIVSLGYNIGVAGFCKSTAAKRINRGDIAGACEAATWFNRAGGKVSRGLQNRRSAEYDLCMEGVREGVR